MKFKNVKWLFIMLLFLSTTLAACGSNSKDTDGNDSSSSNLKEVNLLEAQEIPTLDVSLATDAVSLLVMTNVYEGLYRLGENDSLEDGLAIGEPEISEDGKTYTFELRDSKWSNGDDVTAHDFVYSWQRIVTPETKAEYSHMLSIIENADEIIAGNLAPEELGVKAIDDNHLEVTLASNVPYFKSLLTFPSFFPLNQEFVESQGSSFGTQADAVLYNGPYVLSSWKHEDGWVYEKNDDYWENDVVNIDKINVKVVKDTNTGVNLYETGKVDNVLLTSEQVSRFKDRSDFGTFSDPSTYFLRFNNEDPVFANVDVRKAVSMAWNKEGYVNNLLNNGSIIADFLVPENFVFDEDGNDFRDKFGNMNSHDLGKAQEHWEKAKEALGQSEITVTLLNFDTETSKKTGEYVKEELEKNLSGLTVELKGMPFKQKLELESSGDYEFAFAGWGADFPDPMTFLSMFRSDNPLNSFKFSNSEFDTLIDQINGELLNDIPARWEAMQNAERILIEEEQGIGPVYQKGVAYLRNPNLTNMFNHNFGGDYSYKWMDLED